VSQAIAHQIIHSQTNTMAAKSRLPFDRELESLLPDYDELIRSGQTPVQVHGILLPEVTHEEHTFLGTDKNQLIMSIFRKKGLPDTGPQKRPTIYHIHGGGMIMGNRFCNLSGLLEFVRDYDAICTTIEYRLAPEHPYPAPIEDCYAGLVWVQTHAEELGIDSARIVINGLSAGGGLAAGVALLCRDRKGPLLIGQSLFSPMIDDRNDSDSAHEFTGVGIWDRNANMTGWNAYLGDRRGTGNVSVYAAPIRAKDLAGLPSAYIDVGSTETFRDEDVQYAQNMWRDGTQCELHVWPGAYHGFEDLNPGAQLSIMARKARSDWLRRVLFC
jgi:acetyl esterase/lipase